MRYTFTIDTIEPIDGFESATVCIADKNGYPRIFRVKEAHAEGRIRKLEVPTSLGTLVATETGDANYPGIDIALERGGISYGLVLAEVVEPGTGVCEEAAVHIRPYAAPEKGMKDQDGYTVPGRISFSGPFSDTCLKAEDFKPE